MIKVGEFKNDMQLNEKDSRLFLGSSLVSSYLYPLENHFMAF